MDLVSEWASDKEGSQGYLKRTRAELNKETSWFNPSRAIFKFSTPTLSSLTNSPYAKSLTPIIKPFVMLNHSIRRLFDSLDRYHAFVFGDARSTKAYFQSLPLTQWTWDLLSCRAK